ncbi:hypothetical protein PNIG_a3806 [Pseudoalteromonas nigrifaciens]|uniref:Uncharacterized protein n=2 Tax=Pseudoalteromonas TaxID=53246 RepID=A0AAC9XZC3_9GAMM|nr:hypothetical protein PTRA_a3582 [Pseudoalteromonas translucida KMM 520]ASM55653.1 hypothetical protein PNIG_a3806 [Pseudoalteromonas nigrifaciens]
MPPANADSPAFIPQPKKIITVVTNATTPCRRINFNAASLYGLANLFVTFS